MYEYFQSAGHLFTTNVTGWISRLNTDSVSHTRPSLKLRTIVGITALIYGAHSQAFELNLVLVDESENPVAGAVIELSAEQRGALSSAIGGNPSATSVGIIDQIERRFVPMVLLITAGQSVNFPNSDNVRHHVYSFSDIKQFSTPLYAGESIEPVLFDKPGIAVLGCNIHDSMVAYVYVSESAASAISDEHGNIKLTGAASNPGSVTVWHPWLQTQDNRIDIDVSTLSEGGQLRVSLPVRSPETRFGFRALVPGA